MNDLDYFWHEHGIQIADLQQMADYAEFEITETQIKDAERERIVAKVKTEQANAEPERQGLGKKHTWSS